MKIIGLFHPTRDLKLLSLLETGDREILSNVIETWDECMNALAAKGDSTPFISIGKEASQILTRQLKGGNAFSTKIRRTINVGLNGNIKLHVTQRAAVKEYERSSSEHLKRRFQRLAKKRPSAKETEKSINTALQKVHATRRFIAELRVLIASEINHFDFVIAVNEKRSKKNLTLKGLAQVYIACARIVEDEKRKPASKFTEGKGRAIGAGGMQSRAVIILEPSDKKCGRPCIHKIGLPQIAEDMSACRALGKGNSDRI